MAFAGSGGRLGASGFSADRFTFLGFLPRKGPERRQRLDQIVRSDVTVVLFEAPPRLASLLRDLAQAAGPSRRVAVARELTKVHEEIREGSLGDLAAHYTANEPLGEVTVLVAGAPEVEPPLDVEGIQGEARRLLAGGLSRKDAIRQLTESRGLRRNEVYRLVMELE